MTEEEWIEDCAALLTIAPFNWSEKNARDYAAGLLSFFGVDVEPEVAFEEDRQYWDCEDAA